MAAKSYLRRATRRRWLSLAMLGLVSLAVLLLGNEYALLIRAAKVYATEGPSGMIDRVKVYSRLLIGSPVEFPSSTPEHFGMDSTRLDKLVERLAEQDTGAFLLVKDGHLVYEWYAEGYQADTRQPTAALAKPVIGGVVLMAAMDDGRIRLEDPAWKYIPQWKDDPQKSQITIGQLGSHQSGLDDVVFEDNVSPGWKLAYYRNPELRFRMALSVTPLVFRPGTQTVYSGVGYYALAYALAHSLQGAPEPDLREYLTHRIMLPLQIPPEAWDMSYGTRYQQDGMTLYAIGSGGGYTPRAVARIGEFMLNRGEWNGKPLVSPASVDAILGYADSSEGAIGWATNSQGFSHALPQDAFWGQGKDDQVLLVIPSLDLVMVRMGGSLSPEWPSEYGYYAPLEQHLLQPLMEAIR